MLSRLCCFLLLLVSTTDGTPNNGPKCFLGLVDGCPIELEGSECERLRGNDFSNDAQCAHKLWVSQSQHIYHEYSQTHSYTTKWTPIDKLHCDGGIWNIYFTDATAHTHQNNILLNRKVMCSKSRPSLDADAFIDHNFYVHPSTFPKVKPSPIAFCHEASLSPGCNPPDGFCVLSYKDGVFRPSCACQYGYKNDICSAWHDPFQFDVSPLSRTRRPEAPRPNAIRDTCHVLLAEGCPDTKFDKCDKLRVFDNGVYCAKQLWVGAEQEWSPIQSLECVNERWQVVWPEGRKENLHYSHRVQCANEKPWTRVAVMFVQYKMDVNAEGEVYTDEVVTFNFYCFRNSATCQEPAHCYSTYCLDYDKSCITKSCICRNNTWTENNGVKDIQITKSYVGTRCQRDGAYEYRDLQSERDYYNRRYHPMYAQVNNGTRSTEICDPADLEDGCNGGDCKKLKANATHVKCNELLWLNYGGGMILDWHEISGVRCVDHSWRSECSKAIGKSQLICASSRPSSISSTLWLTLLISAVATLFSGGLACAMCLLCRKRRKVQRAIASARTPHSTACPSSTQHSENTVTEKE